jgi:hypothetical protein
VFERGEGMNAKSLAKKAGFNVYEHIWIANEYDIELFAELVRQDERERIKQEAQRCYVEKSTKIKSDFKTQMDDNWSGII